MTPSPLLADVVALGAGVLIGLIFVVAGVVAVVRRALSLRKRLDRYADLPLWKNVELAEARVSIAGDALATVPSLQARAGRALRDIEAAREEIRSAAFAVSTGVGAFFSFLIGERRAAPTPTAERNPGS